MTIRRLVLVRHAKSVREGSRDSERPLANRGVRDAPAAGRWLAGHGVVPGHVVVSPAVRARQTWQLACAELGSSPPPTVDDRLYRNTVDDLLDVIRETAAGVSTLLLVGHNPSLEDLAVVLDDGKGDAPGVELRKKFPTSGIAVLTLSSDWAAVDMGTATLEYFAVPRG